MSMWTVQTSELESHLSAWLPRFALLTAVRAAVTTHPAPGSAQSQAGSWTLLQSADHPVLR